MIHVLIVDDHTIVSAGLASVLPDDEVEIVGIANDAESALAAVELLHPDVVLMDLRLGDESGVDATRDIRSLHPKTKVLMLTAYSDDEASLASMMAGASGFFSKRVAPAELREAIKRVAAGELVISPENVDSVLRRLQTLGAKADRRTSGEDLTENERRVLDLVINGETNAEIAAHLGYSEKTIKNRVSVIYRKLGVVRRSEAVAKYLQISSN